MKRVLINTKSDIQIDNIYTIIGGIQDEKIIDGKRYDTKIGLALKSRRNI